MTPKQIHKEVYLMSGNDNIQEAKGKRVRAERGCDQSGQERLREGKGRIPDRNECHMF